MNQICVIIPMYGFAEMTRKCIDLVKSNAGMDCDILVVDDGSEEAFTSIYDPIEGVQVTRLRHNQGFTGATNHGILWCGDKYKYVHLLNNDTEPYKDFIKILYDYMEADSSIGIASSARETGHGDDGYIENYGADLIRGFQIVSKEDLSCNYAEILWVPLCSSLVSHRMIREIGLLDKHMRTHCSDNDYCVRARMADYKVILVPKSKVFHIHEVTTSKNHVDPQLDQRALLEKIAGLRYADLMTQMPLDAEQQTYGKITFEVYKK